MENDTDKKSVDTASTSPAKYCVNKETIFELDNDIKKYDNTRKNNWGIACFYISIMIIANVFIGIWGYVNKNPEFKDLPCILNIILGGISVFFAFIHPWQTYLCAKSTRNALRNIKEQYRKGIDNFDKCTNADAQKKVDTMIYVAKKVYDETNLQNDANGFNEAMKKMSENK